MTISIIVAIAENRVIGNNNQLLWHLPDDLKRFKKLTTGHPVIMGRNTWFSLPIKPLPRRTNIVITDKKEEKYPGAISVFSIHEALEQIPPGEEAFVMGGGMVYKQFLPLAQKIYLTQVHHSFTGDTYFPEINPDEWIKEEEIFHPADENHPYSFSFIVLNRKNS